MSSIEHSYYYAVLLLEPGATIDQVKESFRMLSRRWHPDQFAGDAARYRQAVEKQKKLNEAYAILLKALRDAPPGETKSSGGSRPQTSRQTTDFRPDSRTPAGKSGTIKTNGQQTESMQSSLWTELTNQGRRYETGNGCQKDLEKAMGYYRQAARMGSISACFRLGCIYMNMKPEDANNQKMAAEYFQQAANCGHVASLFNLGLMYERGVGVKRDLKTASEMYGHAAARGDVQSKRRLEKLNSQRPEPKNTISSTFTKSRDCFAGN
jgi:curved DNA-binding protein CbpA